MKISSDHAARLLSASPGALLELDADGVIAYANPAAAKLLRRPLEELVGQRIDADFWAIAGLDGEPIPAPSVPVHAVFRGESVAQAELSVAAPDGSRLFLSGSAEPVRDADGRVVGAVVALSDFSDAKRVRDQLRHSNDRMSFALNAAKMIAWDWDPESGTVDHSEDAGADVGGRVERRDQFQQFIHPDDRARVEDTFDAALKRGEDYDSEYRLLLPGSGVRWVASRGRVSIDADGRRRMSGVIADISERKAADAALLESEERLRIAVEGSGAGFYDLDLASGEGVWSQAAFDMLGVPATLDNRAHFTMWRDRLHPEDAGAVLAAHAAAEAELGKLVVEYRIIRANDGDVRWLSTYGRIYQRPDGSRRSVGIVLDTTERRRAEEREKLLMREVDHRAKNVLAVVQSLLQLTPRRDIESFVHGVSGRIAAIARVHTLLAHSRWRAASVQSLIRDELAAYRAADQISIAGEDAAVEPEVAQAIAMITHELATNAAKYGALSRKDGRLDVGVERTGAGLMIFWTERAPQIAAAPARQGFGMRLIRQLVERQLDGAVHFDWAEGAMAVRLDLKAHIDPAAPAAGGGSAHDPRPADLSGRRVLVLEDDALIGMALQQELERQGARPVLCSSIDAALALLERETPELAVLDVNVHGRTAAPVAALLAERSVPFIYATGYSDALGELPRAPIVRKPCAPLDVAEALSQARAQVG